MHLIFNTLKNQLKKLSYRSSILNKYQGNMLKELMALEKDVSVLKEAEDNALVSTNLFTLVSTHPSIQPKVHSQAKNLISDCFKLYVLSYLYYYFPQPSEIINYHQRFRGDKHLTRNVSLRSI